MAKHRLYIPCEIRARSKLELDTATRHYVLNVLRLRDGTQIEIFDGHGNCYDATLQLGGKRNATIETGDALDVSRESPLRIELLQVLARGEKMDWIIQKAVELGVTSIRPLNSQRCNVRLDSKREQNRFQHWRAVMTNACEQCGRNHLPILQPLTDLSAIATAGEIHTTHRWLLQPDATETLRDKHVASNDSISLLVGPEGGLTENEIEQLSKAGFDSLRLGPRILRCETAAIAAITAVQSRFGDMQ